MACVLQNNNQDLFKSMVVQIESEKKAKEKLEEQLQRTNEKLKGVCKILNHKDNIINNLEIDLKHLINQLKKLQPVAKTNIELT